MTDRHIGLPTGPTDDPSEIGKVVGGVLRTSVTADVMTDMPAEAASDGTAGGDAMTADVAADVRQERIRRGLTAQQAAARAGLAYKTWLRIEAGQRVRNMSWLGVDRLFGLASGETLSAVSNGRGLAAVLRRTVRTSVVEEPIADTLERLADQLRKAGRLLLDDNSELQAENARLREALDLLRPAHHTPYVDEEHQGGNCVDWIMQLLTQAHRAEAVIHRVRQWCNDTESETRKWLAKTHNPECECEVGQTQLHDVAAVRALLPEVTS